MDYATVSAIINRSTFGQLIRSAYAKGTLTTLSGKVDMRVIKSLILRASVTAADGTGNYNLQVVLLKVTGRTYSVHANDKNAVQVCEMYAELETVLEAMYPEYTWHNMTSYASAGKTDRGIAEDITF